MNMKIVGSLIGVVVAILMVGSVLAPIVSDAVAESDTFTNKGLFYVDEVPEGESITYSFNQGVLLVNGEDLSLNNIFSEYPDGASVLFTEHIAIRYTGGDTVIKVRGQINNNLSTLDIVVTNGTITGSYVDGGGNDGTINWTYTEFFGIVPKSDRVMAFAPMYVNGDTDVFVTGLSALSGFGNYYVIKVSGSINDGFTATLYNQGSGTLIEGITSTSVVNYSAVNGYDDFYELESVVFTFNRTTSGGVEETATATFTLMTVPEEINADRTDSLNRGAAAIMMSIIPIMLIALIAMVVVIVRPRY